MKKNKGVTLIALIITVIILLIIAGVCIGKIKGKKGLITEAQRGSEDAKGSEAEEEIRNMMVLR